MAQSPSWQANWFAASQEIPRISRNPKVHYHTHKRPPPVSILGQPNPVPYSHIPPSGDPSYYYPPIYAYVSPVVSFPPVSPARPYTPFSPEPYAPHSQPISFSILSPAQWYYNIIILWDHRRICGPSLTETSICGAYLYCYQSPVPVYHFFRYYLIKVWFSVKKNVTERKICFDFHYNFCLKLYHAKKNSARYYHKRTVGKETTGET